MKKTLFTHFTKLLFITALFVSFGLSGYAQISITTLGSAYTQNFNTLAITGTGNTWTDNSTIAGWYTNRTVYIADDGTNTTGGLHSYGTTSATERSLGALTSGSAATVYMGARTVNNTGSSATSYTISYKGEQWRQTANAQKLVFEYQVGATSLTTGTWTAVTALDFTAPKTGTAGSLDGNASGNYANLSSTITVTVTNGQEIWFRWTKTGSTSPGLGIDDVSITANSTSSSSDIISAGGETTDINYASKTGASIAATTDAIKVWSFTIRDGGGSADADALGTILTSVTINKGTSNGVSNWAGTIKQAALFDGSTKVAEVSVTAESIVFSGLSGANVTAADGGSKTLDLYLTFETGTITDNEQFQFRIQKANTSTDVSGSSFASFSDVSSSVTGDANRIEVLTTGILFDIDASNVVVGEVMTAPTLRAIDDNVNFDLDYNAGWSVAVTTGATTFDGTATTTGNFSSGLATLSNLKFNTTATGNQITVTSGSYNDVSSSFDVTAPPAQIDWANLQWPASGTISLGQNYDVYARVYEPGVTNAVGQGAGIQVWIGYSTSATNPNTWTNWVSATYNGDDGVSNDEYVANLGAALSSTGTYYYASRFQLGSASYVYGGFNGGFWDGSTNVSGTLTVNPAATLDWVNVQYPGSGSITTSSFFDIYLQVYEAGLTEAAGQGAGITAWIGYSTSNTNPNTWTNWVSATFDSQQGNNDEYKATLSGLAAGTYYYASRFKYGLADYVYGGYSASNGGFWDGVTNVSGVLTVTTPEPADYPTAFAAATTAPTYSSIKLTWTDASGAEKYIIKGSNVSYNDITAPSDGTAEADGGLVKNITSGTQEYTFTGLTASTPYFFKIFPYNGAGANINFKTDGTVPQSTATTDAIPTLLLAEDFDYSTGLITAHGWTNHSGTNNPSVTTSSISYPGYLSSGVGNEVSLLSSQDGDVNRTFLAQNSGAVYVSFLVNVTAATTTGDYFLNVSTNPFNTLYYRGRIYAKIDGSNNLAFGIAQSTTSANYSSFTYALGTTYMIVLKYNMVSGLTNDVASIYINPALNSAEPVSGWISNTDASGNDVSDIGSVALRQGSAANAPSLKIDGIRVATLWSDIVGPAMTFTGTGAWNSTSNWSNNTVPLKYNNVTVNGNATVAANAEVASVTVNSTSTLTIDNGYTLTVDSNFSILSDASGTGSFIDKGTLAVVSATKKVQKYLSNTTTAGWYLSTPMSNSDVSVFESPAAGVYTYNPASGWATVGSGALNHMTGYVTKYPVNHTVNFTGNLNTGTKSRIDLARNTTPFNNFGWNLVGNPYPSPIDWDLVVGTDNLAFVSSTKLNAAVHVRKNDGSVLTYVPNITSNDPDRIIPAMQAFWVQVEISNTTASLSLDNSVRVHGANNILKSNNILNLLKLKINRDIYEDEATVLFMNGATDNFDAAFDGVKLYSENDQHPQIYTLDANNEALAINSLPELTANKSVKLGFNTQVVGSFTITAADLSDFDQNVSIHLEDLTSNVITDLRQQNSYTFNSNAIITNDRFVLHFGLTSTNTPTSSSSDVNIYANSNSIYVANVTGDNATVSVFNLLGQEVYSHQLNNASLNKLNVNLPAGQYIVRVINNNKITTGKVVLN